jgi:hypothetical protein
MFWAYRMGVTLSLTGAVCDPHQRFWPVRSFSQRQRRPPRAASSLSPTRRTAMASTNAWPRAKNAAHMLRAPIASRGSSPRPRLTGVSTRTKSRGRFPSPPVSPATMPVAINTSPLPANAETVCRGKIKGFPATPAPRKRRDAAQRSGYVKRPWPHLGLMRGLVVMAGYA